MIAVRVPLFLSVAGRWLRQEPRRPAALRLGFTTLLLWGRGRGLPLGSRPFVVTVTAPSGRPVVLRLWDYIDMLVAREIFLDRDYRVPPGVPVSTIVDLGANTGLAVRFFAAEYPSATIVAAEPDPRNAARLRANVAGLARVRVVEAAVAPEAGSATFFVAAESWASSMSETPGATRVEVECVTLPDVLDGATADVLKVDIEGGEWPLLHAGALQAAASCIVGEAHFDGHDEAELRALLAGFDVTVHGHHGATARFTAIRRS